METGYSAAAPARRYHRGSGGMAPGKGPRASARKRSAYGAPAAGSGLAARRRASTITLPASASTTPAADNPVH